MEALTEELNDAASYDKMLSDIKKSDVDLLNQDRRTTLRRKMTVLSRDPVRNEKMLRRRALQRELKVGREFGAKGCFRVTDIALR